MVVRRPVAGFRAGFLIQPFACACLDGLSTLKDTPPLYSTEQLQHISLGGDFQFVGNCAAIDAKCDDQMMELCLRACVPADMTTLCTMT